MGWEGAVAVAVAGPMAVALGLTRPMAGALQDEGKSGEGRMGGGGWRAVAPGLHRAWARGMERADERM